MLVTLLVSGIVLGCIYGIVAMGYSLIYKASGLMSFTQGDLMTVGAYLGITFYSYMKLPFPIAIVLIAVIMFFLGMMIERGVAYLCSVSDNRYLLYHPEWLPEDLGAHYAELSQHL